MMTVPASQHALRLRRRAAAAQAVLLAFVLAAALFVPRPGQAVLIVPITGHAARLPADVIVLRSGRIAGSILVWPHRSLPILALLTQGQVPLAAPAWACSGNTVRKED